MMGDAFICHSAQDAQWAEVLADRLRAAGLTVFTRREIQIGEVIVDRLEQGIEGSHTGIAVLSPATADDSWAGLQLAALLTRAVERGNVFIPVVRENTEVPALVAAYEPLWFDGAQLDAYDRAVEELIARLKGKGRPLGDPERRPPGETARYEGSRSLVLRLAPTQVLGRPGEVGG